MPPEADVPVFFNPFDPGFRARPYEAYRRLREELPVHESPFGALVLARHDDCNALLRHHAASSDERNSEMFKQFIADNPDFVEPEGEAPFLFRDPPDHTRLRGLVSKAFTPKVVEGLRPRAQQLVDELLDAAAERGSLEVIEEFAYPLPVVIISEMLGVPTEDEPTFRGWSRALARGLDPDFILPDDVKAERDRAIEGLLGYFRELIAERRAQPRDDLLSSLIAAEDEGDKLTEDELLSTITLLLIAGHETTVNLIGNGALALVRHPEQLARLRDDPALARTAIEEVLRYDPPVQMTMRIALEDIELPSGSVIKKGRSGLALIGSANRDPDQFPEPEAFDVGRQDNRHLAFGFGTHFCLGAPLARIEGQAALTSLVRRFDGLELAVDEPAYKDNLVLRGLRELPVRFSSARAAAPTPG